MTYLAYVHLGDEQHAHGVTLPDFAGCFSAADNYGDIPKNVQEALELYAATHHMTRSALIVMATKQLLASADEGR